MSLNILVFLIALALAFDFLNGFHDAANSIATVVSTRVLRPQWAVAWAAFFNVVAFLVFGAAVAATVGKGIIDPALIGGLAGAGITKGGVGTLVASGFAKTAAAIVLSPLLGLVLAVVLTLIVSWICARSTPARVDRWFRRLQLISAALYSLGHGGNDAQKTMGIIW